MKPNEWFTLWMTVAQIVGGTLVTLVGAILAAKLAVAQAERQRRLERRDEALGVIRSLVPKIDDVLRLSISNLRGGAAYLNDPNREADWRLFAASGQQAIGGLRGRLESELSYWWHWLDDEPLTATLQQMLAQMGAIGAQPIQGLREPLTKDAVDRCEAVATELSDYQWVNTIEAHLKRLSRV